MVRPVEPVFRRLFGISVSSEIPLPEGAPVRGPAEVRIAYGETPFTLDRPLSTGVCFAALPDACFQPWPDEGSALEVPLIELADDPAALVERLVIFAYTDERALAF